MSPITIGLVVFATVFGAALAGMWLRTGLSTHNLTTETKEAVRLCMGLVATMAALVLGLLVASTKESYDKEKNEVIQIAAKVGYLDRALTAYGPDAAEARALLRKELTFVIDAMWPEGRSQAAQLAPSAARGDALFIAVQGLAAETDAQRTLKTQAMSLVVAIGQARWLLYEQSDTAVSTPLLLIVVSWLAIIFVSFGLFAPANQTAIAALFVAAISVAGAIFLILELARPFGDFIHISSTPMRNVLEHLGN